jgi:hypothetical protein
MTREQKLEQELAELRKARNALVNCLEDAGKRSVEEKAKLFDAVLPFIRAQVDARLNDESSFRTTSPSDNVVANKVRELILGETVAYLEKL